MKISQSTLDTVFDINEYSDSKLKNVNDVALLLESSKTDDTAKQLFKDMIFTAKYLNGLGKIMMNSITGNINSLNKDEDKIIIESSADKVRKEYKKNVEHFVNQLNLLLDNADESDRKVFNDKYLNMTRSAMVNLTSLIYDLSWIKKYYNEKGL